MLCAWLPATGIHWDVVQLLAWSRMFVNHARVLPLRDALELTFSPDGRCGVCVAVQSARQDDGATVAAFAAQRLNQEPLVFPSATPVVLTPPATALYSPDGDNAPVGHGRAAPPTPPPRADGFV